MISDLESTTSGTIYPHNFAKQTPTQRFYQPTTNTHHPLLVYIMKFSLLTITGALASANAATIRGDQSSRSLKKIALMRKFTDALNKKARPVTRRLDEQGDQEEEEEITAETVMTVGYCVSAKVYGYNGDNNGDNNANYSGNTATMSYISFSTGVGSEYSYDSAYGNQGEEYVTSLDTYLQVVGESYAVEKSSLYSQCAMMASYW